MHPRPTELESSKGQAFILPSILWGINLFFGVGFYTYMSLLLLFFKVVPNTLLECTSEQHTQPYSKKDFKEKKSLNDHFQIWKIILGQTPDFPLWQNQAQLSRYFLNDHCLSNLMAYFI